MTKGDHTRTLILEAGMNVAGVEGLEALSIGRLADRVGMSKSGLFAHFRSKEGLQLAVLAYTRDHFIQHVVVPAMSAPRGEPRLRALLDRWLAWGAPDADSSREGGCVFLQAAAEFDDRPGSVREAVAASQRDWIDALTRATAIAIEEGHLRADLDPAQFAFEMHGVILSFHFQRRLLDEPEALPRTRAAFERLLASARPA
ncbi:MAG: helix-turn-helix domain-containing protein [Planctomycetota bacterium]